MKCPTRAPSRETVERVAAAVAVSAGLSLADVVGASRKRPHARARRDAIRQIISETGCSIKGLARVWGCDRRSIQRGLELAPREMPLAVGATQ